MDYSIEISYVCLQPSYSVLMNLCYEFWLHLLRFLSLTLMFNKLTLEAQLLNILVGLKWHNSETELI